MYVKLIRKDPNVGGDYPLIQEGAIPAVPPGMAVVPDDLDTAVFYEYNGFVTLSLDGDRVVGMEPNVAAWEAWQASLPEPEPEPEPEPTEVEQLRADVDYLAVMTGVTL